MKLNIKRFLDMIYEEAPEMITSPARIEFQAKLRIHG